MTRLLRPLVAILTVGLLASVPAAAQWPPYPTPNVPRLPDGSPDLDGPVPRTADDKPDLTGIWSFHRRGRSGEQGRPVGEPAQPEPGDPPFVNFWDIGYGFDDGLPYRPWAAALREERMANNGIDNPDSYCLPLGHMQFHTHPQPRKIIQTPDVIVILYEASAGVRQIFTDGRALPDNDPLPWWYGYSVGTWEGDTLVVETSHLRDNGWLDFNGSPHSDQVRITERFTRVSFGHIEIDVTIDDPVAYTEPFTVRVEHDIMLDTNLIEWVCEDEQSTQYFER
jgi:hypothetical protein